MPLSADELIQRSQTGSARAMAGARAQVQEAQTPPSDEGQALRSTPEPLSERLAGAVPAAVAPYARAAGQAVLDPAQRLVQRGLRGVTTMPGETAADAFSVAGTASALPLALMGAPEALVGLAAGVGAQGAGEQAGFAPNTARILGAVGALVGGMGTGSARAALRARAGGAIAAEGEGMSAVPNAQPGTVQSLPRAEVGGFLKSEAGKAMVKLKDQIGGDVRNAENAIVRSTPQITPDHPTYSRLASELMTLDERGITIPTKGAGDALTNIRNAIDNGQPVMTRDVAKLRSDLAPVTQRPFVAAAGGNDPSLAFLRVFRNKLGDTLEGVASPNQQFQYATARDAYLNQVVRPSKVLHSILSQDTSPADAYAKVFNYSGSNPDLETYRRLVQTISAGSPSAMPATTAKLRMGFMDTLAQATNNFSDARTTLAAFQAQRPVLAASGLYSPEELSQLEFWIRRGELPGLVQKAANVVSNHSRLATAVATGGAVALAEHAPAVVQLAQQHPIGLLGAILAGGGLKTLNTMRLLPLGHSSMAALGTQALGNIGRVAVALRQGQHDEPTWNDGTVDH